MARLHIIWGLMFVGVFLGTGMFMLMTFPNQFHQDATMRMLYRSAHVYILLAGLINGVLGVYLTLGVGWRRQFQLVGSSAILMSPVVFALAFFIEPAPRQLERPLVLLGLILALLGTLLHMIAAVRVSRSSGEPWESS